MLQQKHWYDDFLRAQRETHANPGVIPDDADFYLTLGAIPEAGIRVSAFYGAEALNELYRFDVVF